MRQQVIRREHFRRGNATAQDNCRRAGLGVRGHGGEQGQGFRAVEVVGELGCAAGGVVAEFSHQPEIAVRAVWCGRAALLAGAGRLFAGGAPGSGGESLVRMAMRRLRPRLKRFCRRGVKRPRTGTLRASRRQMDAKRVSRMAASSEAGWGASDALAGRAGVEFMVRSISWIMTEGTVFFLISSFLFRRGRGRKRGSLHKGSR